MNTPTRGTTSMLLLAVLWASGCGRDADEASGEPLPASSSASVDAPPATVECPADFPHRFGGACCQFEDGSACIPGCEGHWQPWLADTNPWWASGEPRTCLDRPVHTPSQPYDDCSSGAPPDLCGTPYAGALVCLGEYWEVACQATADCPADMVCVVGEDVRSAPRTGVRERGFCAKTCTGTGGSAECLRCDLSCGPAGYCRRPTQHTVGHPCTTDCECWDVVDLLYGTTACIAGVCQTSSAPRTGLCGNGAESDCLCGGGVCEEHPGGGCCRLPDGSIAGSGSVACGAR